MLGFVQLLALNAVLVSGTADGLPAAEEVEKQVLEYRQALKHAELKLSQATYLKESGPPDRERRTRIWFDGKKLRNDIELRYNADQPFHREIHGHHCEREGYLLFYSQEPPAPGTALAMSFQKIEPATDPLSCPVIDPRLLGLAVCSSPDLAQSHFEEWVRPPNRRPPSIRKTTLNGKDLLLIEYTLLNGVLVRTWVAPEWGPSIVRMEAEDVVDGKQMLDSTVCDYADPPPGRYWYPKSCTYQRMIDGKLANKEVAQVEIVSLNQPIPPEAFTLAGMGIAKGTPIKGLPTADKADGPRFWNGETILTQQMPRIPADLPGASTGWRRPFLLGGSLFLALIAGLLVWCVVFRKRRA
jgi:hypothetical protein